MPNHVTNILQIDGDREEVERVKKAISSDHGRIDFKTVLPTPPELEEIIASFPESSKEVDGKRVYLTIADKQELMSKYGAINWYDWQVKNWGTKWNAYSDQDLPNGRIMFETAWSTPIDFFVAASKRFPKVIFSVAYADEDTGHNCGMYQIAGGEVKKEVDLGDGSDTARLFASAIYTGTIPVKDEFLIDK